jgi:menaquinone-specific isochorismate synthase
MSPSFAFHTVSADLPAHLLDLAPSPDAMTWLRRRDGIVAWGEVARAHIEGPDRFERAAAWWRDLIAASHAEGPSGPPGIGPVVLGSFAFDPADPSVLIVPRVAVVRRRGQGWITTASPATDDADRLAPAPIPPLTEHPGHHTARQWPHVVSLALEAIRRGDVEKVVLARDVLAEGQSPVDVRTVVDRLTAGYPDCWTFAVDGLVGATPELLIRSARGLVTSRVLAGTIRRTGDDHADLARAATLARSSKDLEEHQFAVESVVQGLTPFVDELSVPDGPSVLHLPNVMHLATDVVGDLTGRADGTSPSSLELAGALHPTAAVCGTPRDAAFRLIGTLEGASRGRYSGPVGWMGADGSGEWGIALRCAQFSPDRRAARLWAGGGIVGASVPDDELAETEAKLMPMRGALGLARPSA